MQSFFNIKSLTLLGLVLRQKKTEIEEPNRESGKEENMHTRFDESLFFLLLEEKRGIGRQNEPTPRERSQENRGDVTGQTG